MIDYIKEKVFQTEGDEYNKKDPLTFIQIKFALKDYNHKHLDYLLRATELENIRAKKVRREVRKGIPWYAMCYPRWLANCLRPLLRLASPAITSTFMSE